MHSSLFRTILNVSEFVVNFIVTIVMQAMDLVWMQITMWLKIRQGYDMSDEITAGLIGAGAALIGAFVGAYAGYKFNERLEANRVIERRQIQTKNIIFSPIYKQLLGLKTYLQQHQKPLVPTFKINFRPGRHSYNLSYTFDVWENMKGDIRKLYVPTDKRDELELLTNELKAHMELQREVESAIVELAVEFAKTQKDRQKADGGQNPRLLGMTLSNYSSGHAYPGLQNDIVQRLKAGFEFTEKELKEHSAALLKRVDSHKEQRRLVDSFNRVTETAVRVSGSFEKLVDDIIRKYEGGGIG